MIPTADEMDKWMVEIDKFEHQFVKELSPYQQEKLYSHVLTKLKSIHGYNMRDELKFHYEKMLVLLRHFMNQNGNAHTLEEIEKILASDQVASPKNITRYVLATIFYYKQIQIDARGYANGIDLFEKYKGELQFANRDGIYNAYRDIAKDEIRRKKNAAAALSILRKEGDYEAIERLLKENPGTETKC